MTELGVMFDPPRDVIGVLWSMGEVMCRGSPGCKRPQGACGAVPCQATVRLRVACMNTCHENVTCHGTRMSVLICCMTAQPEAQS